MATTGAFDIDVLMALFRDSTPATKRTRDPNRVGSTNRRIGNPDRLAESSGGHIAASAVTASWDRAPAKRFHRSGHARAGDPFRARAAPPDFDRNRPWKIR